MSVFTIIIIIWVIYQVFLSLMKKGRQAGRNFDPLKLPDSRSLREVVQKSAPGFPQTMKAWLDDYIQTEGTQGVEGRPGIGEPQWLNETQEAKVSPVIEGAGAYEEGNSNKKMPEMPLTGDGFAFTQRELLQGVVLAEILGKPRALQPFRGPRS